jgi:class 3 adenylate cyclase
LRPTGTVTFLFTDIEGSTRLWENQAQEMRLAFLRAQLGDEPFAAFFQQGENLSGEPLKKEAAA